MNLRIRIQIRTKISWIRNTVKNVRPFSSYFALYLRAEAVEGAALPLALEGVDYLTTVP
jgi:hypothetical protein